MPDPNFRLYRIERRLIRGEFRWAILKNGAYYGSTLRYLSAFKICALLNENADLSIAKIAHLQTATVRERGSRQFTSTEQRLLRAVGNQ